jgi:hypothetical protein
MRWIGGEIPELPSAQNSTETQEADDRERVESVLRSLGKSWAAERQMGCGLLLGRAPSHIFFSSSFYLFLFQFSVLVFFPVFFTVFVSKINKNILSRKEREESTIG